MADTTNEEKICPYCRSSMQPGAQVIVCNACGSALHTECWQQNDGCTTFGCLGRPTTVPPPARLTPSISPPLLSENNPPPGYLPATLPSELRQWNWGAFLLAMFWSAAMRQWFWFTLWFALSVIFYVSIIPNNNVALFWSAAMTQWFFYIRCVSIIPHIYLASKGNELSWESRHWDSLEQFKATQEVWKKWGIGVFWCCVLLFLAAIIDLLFFSFRAREGATIPTCMKNQRQLCVDIIIYAQDNDGKLPNAQTVWKSLPVSPQMLVCPTAGGDMLNGYGYNQQLSGLTVDDLKHPNTLLMTADSGIGANIIHTKQDISFRHTHKAIGSFCDGHVAAIPEVQPIRLAP